MNKVVLMAVVDGRHDLAEETSGLFLIDPVLVSLANVLKELATASVLHNQDVAVVTLDHIIQNCCEKEEKKKKKKKKKVGGVPRKEEKVISVTNVGVRKELHEANLPLQVNLSLSLVQVLLGNHLQGGLWGAN